MLFTTANVVEAEEARHSFESLFNVRRCRVRTHVDDGGPICVKANRYLLPLPEAFFDTQIFIGTFEEAAEALRRVIVVGERGQGLTVATEMFLRNMASQDRRGNMWQFCTELHRGYGALFIAMCDTAKALQRELEIIKACLLYTSDAADE